MPRRRCKIKSVDEIRTLDSSSVRRLCSSSVPERREEALREVLRRAAQWDMECQDYARKLRVWQPQNVLRCLEGEPRAVGFVPPCREFCVPSFMPDTVLEDKLVAVNGSSSSVSPVEASLTEHAGIRASSAEPQHHLAITLDVILEEALAMFDTASVSVDKDTVPPSIAPLALDSSKRRVRGGKKWRTAQMRRVEEATRSAQ